MSLTDNLAKVRASIDDACRAAGRAPTEVRLLPVSKYHGTDAIRAAHTAGYSLFGENKVQELAEKARELDADGIGFSMIGHVQTNKARDVALLAAELQSLDSLRLAEALDRRLTALGRRLPVLVQVNTSGEAAKSGIRPEDAVRFAKELTQFEALEPRGLMTMAIKSPDDEQVAACFRALVDAQARVRDAVGDGWAELSMGMSGDFRTAIREGSTCVRIGTAIFGSRPPIAPTK